MVATSPDPVEIPPDSPPQTRQQKKRRVGGIARTDTPAARRPLSEEDTSPTDEGSATNHDASTDLISDDEDSATSPSDTPTPQRQRLQRSDTSSTNASTSASAEAQRLGVDASTRILKRHTPEQVAFIQEQRKQQKFSERLERRLDRANSRTLSENARAEANEAKKRELILSLTLEWQGHHLPLDVWGQFRQFLDAHSSWYGLAYEKGPTNGLWHAQGVGVFFDTSPVSVKKRWQRFAARYQNAPQCKVNHCFKEAAQKGLSTRLGLLGYVRKDIDEYEGHLCVTHEKVTDEEKRQGDLLFLAYGKTNKTAECTLTQNNLIDRAALFFEKKVKNPVHQELDFVLCQMLQTGKYTVHGHFFTHNGSMVYHRAQAALVARLNPDSVSVDDVHHILFNRRTPRDEFLASMTVDRDRVGTRDPFEAKDAFVHLNDDRCSDSSASSVEPEPSNSAVEAEPLASLHSTEVRSNNSATAHREPPPSLYFSMPVSEPRVYPEPIPSSSSSSLPHLVVGAGVSPTRNHDPRYPPFFVQNTPGLNFRFVRDPARSPPPEIDHTRSSHSTETQSAHTSGIHDTETERALERVELSSGED